MKNKKTESMIAIGIGALFLSMITGKTLTVSAKGWNVTPVTVVTEVSTDTAVTLSGTAIEAKETILESKYTNEDLYILSHIICGEAQGYSDELQLAVGSVFLNRVNDPRYPNTFEGVAFQKGQYACTWDGNYYRQPTERNIANAIYLLENGSQLPENVVFQSEVRQGKGVYKKIKLDSKRYMYFCY